MQAVHMAVTEDYEDPEELCQITLAFQPARYLRCRRKRVPGLAEQVVGCRHG
jgi:hypothetical protein